MTKNKFSGTRTENMKLTACTGSMPVSRICSLSQLIQSRPASEGKKSNFVERKALDAKNYKRENYDSVVHKNVAFCSPSLIRIRATDKEGNSIEVTL